MLGHQEPTAQRDDESCERVGVGKLQRRIVDLVHLYRFATDAPPGGISAQRFVAEDVVIREDEVVRGQRLAIRPLQPLPQVQGEGAVLIRQLPACHQPGLDGTGSRLVPDDLVASQNLVEALVSTAARIPVHLVVGLPRDAHVNGAAVLPRLEAADAIPCRIVSGQHERVIGEPLVHRGKLATRHSLGEHRRFSIRTLLGRQRDWCHCRNQQQEQCVPHPMPPMACSPSARRGCAGTQPDEIVCRSAQPTRTNNA